MPENGGKIDDRQLGSAQLDSALVVPFQVTFHSPQRILVDDDDDDEFP